MLVNIVDNAIRYNRPGGQVSVIVDERPAAIRVEDDGPGIPEDIRDKVFYPLVSGREGGSGLGLTLVQNFVTQHHGTVAFETQPGGTTFTLLLPIQQHTTH